MSTKKKFLLISGLVLDGGLTIFLFIISILMIIKSQGLTPIDIQELKPDNLINYLIKNPTVFLCAFVVPLFVLLIGNIVFLVIYVKRSSKHTEVTMSDLSDEQIEALKKELLNDITKKNNK